MSTLVKGAVSAVSSCLCLGSRNEPDVPASLQTREQNGRPRKPRSRSVAARNSNPYDPPGPRGYGHAPPPPPQYGHHAHSYDDSPRARQYEPFPYYNDAEHPLPYVKDANPKSSENDSASYDGPINGIPSTQDGRYDKPPMTLQHQHSGAPSSVPTLVNSGPPSTYGYASNVSTDRQNTVPSMTQYTASNTSYSASGVRHPPPPSLSSTYTDNHYGGVQPQSGGSEQCPGARGGVPPAPVQTSLDAARGSRGSLPNAALKPVWSGDVNAVSSDPANSSSNHSNVPSRTPLQPAAQQPQQRPSPTNPALIKQAVANANIPSHLRIHPAQPSARDAGRPVLYDDAQKDSAFASHAASAQRYAPSAPPSAPRASAPSIHVFNDPSPPTRAASVPNASTAHDASHAALKPQGDPFSRPTTRDMAPGNGQSASWGDATPTGGQLTHANHSTLATVDPPRPVNSNLVNSVMKQKMGVTVALEHMTNVMPDHHSAAKQVKKIKLLGKGGFGTVYLATMDGGKEKVALKELSAPLEFRPYSQNPSEVLGTLREAAIQALMVHTNIVRTYWADVSVVHPQTGKPLGVNWASVMEGHHMEGHVVEDCTTSAGTNEPQAEWLSVEGLMSETKRLTEIRVLPELVGLNVRIAMEYCELGSLIDYVAPRSKGARVIPLNVAIGGNMEMTLCAALTALDIARGLKLLHKYQIVHGDLKPHNILIASNPSLTEQGSVQDPRGFVAKLSDFGLSKHMRRGETEVNGITHGSVEYMPLEARQSRTVTKASDVYAFGIIMWELWHNDCWAPHFKAKQHKLKAQFAAAGRTGGTSLMKTIAPQCAPLCPPEYASVVSDCLDKDPSKRPRIAQICRRLELFIDKRLFPERPPAHVVYTASTGGFGTGPTSLGPL